MRAVAQPLGAMQVPDGRCGARAILPQSYTLETPFPGLIERTAVNGGVTIAWPATHPLSRAPKHLCPVI